MRSKVKILVVDDRKENLFAFRKIIKDLDVEVVEAESGNEALSKSLKHNFALILLDVQMPEMDGEEVAYFLKNNDKTKGIPIMFLTAIDRDDSRALKGYETGAVDYIFKPINKEILTSKIKVFIELYQSKYELNQLVEEKVKHLKEAYEDLKEAKIKADAANKAKTEFLSNMSHEIRTPMHAILSFSRSILKDLKNKEEVNEKIIKKASRIRESGERLMHLLNDLLDLSKLEANKMEFKKEESDIKNTIQVVVDELSQMFCEKKLNVSIISNTDKAIAYFDSYKIQQVIRNILSNAIKFSDIDGNINIIIDTCKRQNIEYLKVEIENFGTPIPRDEIKLIFDKFVQSSNTNLGSGGTGLGLPICKKIIECHQGLIWAESSEERETKFIFTIPLEEMKKNVLLFEGDENGVIQLSNVIRKEGFDVISTKEENEAVYALGSKSFSAMLIDVSTLNKNGVDLAIKFKEKFPDIKIAFLSKESEETISNNQLLNLKKVEFIEKPISSEKVVRFLSKIAS